MVCACFVYEMINSWDFFLIETKFRPFKWECYRWSKRMQYFESLKGPRGCTQLFYVEVCKKKIHFVDMGAWFLIYYHLTNLICGRLNMKITFYYFLHLTCIFDFIFNFFLKIAKIIFLYTTIIVELKSNTKLRSTWTLQSEKNCRLWICLLAKCEYQRGLYPPIQPQWYHPESIRQLGLFASVHHECKLTTEESSA